MLRAVKTVLAEKDASTPLPVGKKHHALILSNDQESADSVVVQAAELGIIVMPYHGSLPSYSLENHLKWFQNDAEANRILAVVDMLREGYDYPPISVVAFASKVSAPVKMYQFIGRGFRVLPGEKDVFCDVIVHKDHKLEALYKKCLDEKLVPITVDGAFVPDEEI